MTIPSLFLSHGAPTLPLTDTPARAFLQQLGHELERPKAILVISAHWETAVRRSTRLIVTRRSTTSADFRGRSMTCATLHRARQHLQRASQRSYLRVASIATSINAGV